jgi:hypothetical protein
MATGLLIGSSTQGTGNIGGDQVRYSKFTAEATGKVTEIKVYSLVSGSVKVAIYADNAGEPGNKITGNDDSQDVTLNQWNTLTIAETYITEGTVYWLGICTSVTGAASGISTGGIGRYKTVTYSTFTWPDSAGTGFTSSTYKISQAGWGVLVLSPSGIQQSISLGSPKLSFILKPAGIEQPVACGTPTVLTSGQVIQPSGIEQAIAVGTPTIIKLLQIIYPSGIEQPISIGTPYLRYPQTISPGGVEIPIIVGEPSVGIYGIIKPDGIEQVIAIGMPTVLKYVWHVVLDGQYAADTQRTNRAYVIGRDINGNPVYGTAVDSTELGLVGERLDFQQELAIPTSSQAESMASAILSKMRLSGKSGVILIPPNCGQELFDVVQVTDSQGNQAAVKFRVVGIRFEYNPRQARYHHKLILGAP